MICDRIPREVLERTYNFVLPTPGPDDPAGTSAEQVGLPFGLQRPNATCAERSGPVPSGNSLEHQCARHVAAGTARHCCRTAPKSSALMEHCNGAHWIQLIYAYAALHSMYAGGSGQPDEHLVSRILLKDYTAGE